MIVTENAGASVPSYINSVVPGIGAAFSSYMVEKKLAKAPDKRCVIRNSVAARNDRQLPIPLDLGSMAIDAHPVPRGKLTDTGEEPAVAEVSVGTLCQKVERRLRMDTESV